jgi:small neutral amino acid transporter SnatA (MarC family)
MTDADYALGAAKLFTLFFVTLGPLKLLGPFFHATATLPADQLRGLALRTAAFAAGIAIVGGFLGRSILANWMVDVFVLRFATGLILFVVAFRLVMQQYEAPAAAAAPPAEPPHAMQLVFPMVLTPYGLGALIGLLTLSRGTGRSGLIVALLLLVMLLGLLAMAFVRPILRAVGPVLQVLGAILGILQVALALQVMLAALRGLGVVGGAP